MSTLSRRGFLATGAASLGFAPGFAPIAAPADPPAFRLTDISAAAGLDFRHNSGAFGAKFLPETMGAGCAFLDYDCDGWLDIQIGRAHV